MKIDNKIKEIIVGVTDGQLIDRNDIICLLRIDQSMR